MPVILEKPVGKTPLEIVEEYRKQHPDIPGPVSYAGRLDPMAEGLLLLLVGDENKDRRKFEQLQKEYEFEILFGFSTDSYDLMGMVTGQDFRIKIEELRMRAEQELTSFVGSWEQEYPPYSSAVVAGKPLYWWTRQNKLTEITIPRKEVRVTRIENEGWRMVKLKDVVDTAAGRIEKVTGDFRQDEIINQWKLIQKRYPDATLPLAACRVVCSSGTYVRGLAHSLGRALTTPSLAYSIRRTKIGSFSL